MIARNEETVAEFLSRVMVSSGLTARAVADDAGIHESALSSYRSGRRVPPPKVLISIADALNGRAELLVQLAEEVRVKSGAVTRSLS